jgi:putative ATPase
MRFEPLAQRLRPASIDAVIGQSHLLGAGKPLRRMIETGQLRSLIFWGPPGSGKTTVARLMAEHTQASFEELSAVTSGVGDVRKVLDAARARRNQGHTGSETGNHTPGVKEASTDESQSTLLFIDEIHRFSKSQQDALLHAVEDGTVILIGATTENPSFEVISPLLSRTQVYQFEPLNTEELGRIIDNALVTLEKNPTPGVGFTGSRSQQRRGIELTADGKTTLTQLGGGDARVTLNLLELAATQSREISGDLIESVAQRRTVRYDKGGEEHYNTISAFIKSLRGSDPNATLHYLARMIEAGEDPMFIARRMVIFASEDVGNAAPTALVVATSTMQSVHLVGWPEAQLMLAQCATYLATAPKSRAVVNAIGAAINDVRTKPLDPIPLHLRNAPTKLMKQSGYAKGYSWSGRNDARPGTDRPYLPKNLENATYYEPPRRN